MKNYLNLIVLLIILFTPFYSFADGNWSFTKEADYCYIYAKPIKTIIPEGKSRGEHEVIVYRMNNSTNMIVQVNAGFNYKSSDSIKVFIDDGDYMFFTDADSAWTDEDKKVIFAMKKGLEFVTSAISSKGTEVVDTYSLKGFTAAFNKLNDNC